MTCNVSVNLFQIYPVIMFFAFGLYVSVTRGSQNVIPSCYLQGGNVKIWGTSAQHC